MKKKLVLLLILFFMSGCSVKNISEYSYEQVLDTVIKLDVNNYNTVGKGYKYYMPKGVVRTSSIENNDILRRNNNKYYLFVDVVSYYYKNITNYKKIKNPYFSKELKYKDKNGFVQMIEKDDKIYVQMIYNYAKIETYVEIEDLNQTISDISYILSSIDFNDSLLKKMYESGDLNSKEEIYKLFENAEKEGNFLKYVEEFDKYDEDEYVEEELIIQTTTKSEEETTTSNTEE